MAITGKAQIIAMTAATAMVLGTWAILSIQREVRGGADQPVKLELPGRLGNFVGESIFFCQEDQCLSHFMESELAGETTECPRCKGALDPISPGEKQLLPAGTPIFRKRYSRGEEPFVDVTFVFSGTERRSIHRPQVCLTGQGQSIQNEKQVSIPLPDRPALPVRLLDLYQPLTLPDGRETGQRSKYAYWFFNPERETDSHFNRLARMAFDNILRNYRPRWAYVMVASRDLDNGGQALDRITEMIRLLYPLLEELRRDMATQESS